MVNRFLMQATVQAENLSYGHLAILARECDLPSPLFLNGHLQHGWNGTDGFERFTGNKMRAKKFVWSRRVENEILRRSGRNTVAIGSPWLYLLRAQKVELGNHSGSSGVIAYPDHSQPWAKLNDIHHEYADYLKKTYGASTVSLHWSDFSDIKIRQAYVNFGHTTVSNGVGTPWLENFDSNYLLNQLSILNQHRILVSNVVTTAAFYAMSLGLEVYFGGPVGWTEKNNANSYYGPDGMSYWVDQTNSERDRTQLWKSELGLDCMKNKKDLLETLEWDEFRWSNRLKFLFARFQDILLNGNYIEKLSFATK